MADLSNVRVDGTRLWDSLMEMAKIGATPKGGVKRLTLTDLDGQSRKLFRKWCEAAGCSVTVDEMGNMFARRPGQDQYARPRDDGQPPRHPTDRRQVRRRARGSRRARDRAFAQRSQHPDPAADRSCQLDQRGRVALRPGDDCLGRVRRRLHQGTGLRVQGRRQQGAGRRTRADRFQGRGACRRSSRACFLRAAHRAGSDP